MVSWIWKMSWDIWFLDFPISIHGLRTDKYLKLEIALTAHEILKNMFMWINHAYNLMSLCADLQLKCKYSFACSDC